MSFSHLISIECRRPKQRLPPRKVKILLKKKQLKFKLQSVKMKMNTRSLLRTLKDIRSVNFDFSELFWKIDPKMLDEITIENWFFAMWCFHRPGMDDLYLYTSEFWTDPMPIYFGPSQNCRHVRLSLRPKLSLGPGPEKTHDVYRICFA